MIYDIRRRDAAIKAHQEQLRKDQERKERERKEELQRKREEEVMSVFIILLLAMSVDLIIIYLSSILRDKMTANKNSMMKMKNSLNQLNYHI
jgi:hypothetical protein